MKKFNRLKLKDKDWHGAQWEICIEGPSLYTDLGTLCGKTAWASDQDRMKVDQDAQPTCKCCLGVMKWVQERRL